LTYPAYLKEKARELLAISRTTAYYWVGSIEIDRTTRQTLAQRRALSICISDPAVMRLGHRWIQRFGQSPLEYRIQYHADQNLEELVEFWGAELEIEPTLIRLLRKTNRQFADRSDLALEVRSAGCRSA
jgi:hypothetical protein